VQFVGDFGFQPPYRILDFGQRENGAISNAILEN
jgi:hypothetical protein